MVPLFVNDLPSGRNVCAQMDPDSLNSSTVKCLCDFTVFLNLHQLHFIRWAISLVFELCKPLSWAAIGLDCAVFYISASIGYMGDGFYRSKDPINSIKVLKEKMSWATLVSLE